MGVQKNSLSRRDVILLAWGSMQAQQNQGRSAVHEGLARQAIRESLSRRWNCSTIPLAFGWYTVVA
jgi:hypothetical protein